MTKRILAAIMAIVVISLSVSLLVGAAGIDTPVFLAADASVGGTSVIGVLFAIIALIFVFSLPAVAVVVIIIVVVTNKKKNNNNNNSSNQYPPQNYM